MFNDIYDLVLCRLDDRGIRSFNIKPYKYSFQYSTEL